MFFCCCFVLFCFLGAQGTGLGDLAVEVDGDDVGAQAQQREDGAHGLRASNTKGSSSTYLAMGFANVRAGTLYPPEH